jgi:hypothetical protein
LNIISNAYFIKFKIFFFLENAEVVDGNVIVCKDAIFGKCNSNKCKYYHIPEDILSMQIVNYQTKQQQQTFHNYKKTNNLNHKFYIV